jgi:hypothetical protein
MRSTIIAIAVLASTVAIQAEPVLRVASGGRVLVSATVIIGADCKPLMGGDKWDWHVKPIGGQIIPDKIMDYPKFPVTDSRSAACNSKKVPILGLYYRPVAGFHGKDHFDMTMHTADGRSVPVRATVVVR